jgi:hypothetical protein
VRHLSTTPARLDDAPKPSKPVDEQWVRACLGLGLASPSSLATPMPINPSALCSMRTVMYAVVQPLHLVADACTRGSAWQRRGAGMGVSVFMPWCCTFLCATIR